MTSRPLSRDIAISQFVADSIEGPSVLLPTGVSDQPQAALDSQTVVMLQRLTPEKSPEVGLRAWSAGGLGANGWRLVVAGAGELDGSLRRLADQLGITDSVDFAGLVTDTDRLLTNRPSSWLRRRPSPSGCPWSRPWPTGYRWWRPKGGPTSRRSARTACSSPRGTPTPRPGPWWLSPAISTSVGRSEGGSETDSGPGSHSPVTSTPWRASIARS